MIENITAVTPVRLGSTRVKQKVLLPLRISGVEQSLLVHKLQNLKRIFSNVIVSCGEEEIAEIAFKNGCTVSWRERRFIEPEYKVTTRESITEVVKDVTTEFTAWCPVVVPYHSSETYLSSVRTFENLDANIYDSLATVHSRKSYTWYQQKPLNYFPDERHVQSQLLEPVTHITNGLYLTKTNTIRNRGYFLGSRVYLHEVSFQESIDIDTLDDYNLAKKFES